MHKRHGRKGQKEVESRLFSRREMFGLAGIAGATALFGGLFSTEALSQSIDTGETDRLFELYGSTFPLFFPDRANPERGYHIEQPLQEHWRAHAHGLTLGAPITERIPQNDGTFIQYFETTGLRVNERTGEVTYLPVGREFLAATGDTYNEYLVSPEQVGEVEMLNRYFVVEHGGVEAFGLPLTRPIPVGPDKIQIFENMILMEYDEIPVPEELRRTYLDLYQPKKQLEWNRGRSPLLWPGETLVYPLARELQANGLIPAGNPEGQRGDSARYNPQLWNREQKIIVSTAPNSIGNPLRQRLYAVEGDLIVLEVPISSGRDEFYTPDTDPDGTNIVAWRLLIDYRSPLDGVEYLVPGVPWNMSLGHKPDIFIHGIYWHPNFGRRASHGCINATPLHAKWLYDWSNENTKVIARNDIDTNFGTIRTSDLRRLSPSPPLFPLEDDYQPYAQASHETVRFVRAQQRKNEDFSLLRRGRKLPVPDRLKPNSDKKSRRFLSWR